MSVSNKDIDRLKNVYESFRESQDGYNETTYTTLRDDILIFKQDTEKRLVKIVREAFYNRDVKDLKVLEVGTGWGQRFRTFLDMGFEPSNLYGIDLLQHFIERARKWSGDLNFICGDAQNLPYENDSFDIVFQCVAFSSIIDRNIIKNICSEMIRVLNNDGIIIWIDFGIKDQKKYYKGIQYLQSIELEEIVSFFPNCNMQFENKLYLKPLFWKLCNHKNKYNKFLYNIFSSFNFCKSHYVIVLKKNTKDNVINR
nr:class I SAM-dependent methyltransferase [uncultured Aminipila sp.]